MPVQPLPARSIRRLHDGVIDRLRGRCAAAALTALALAGTAGANAPGIDQRVDAEKQAALSLVQQAMRLEARVGPSGRRLSIYVGTGDGAERLRSATFSIDGGANATHIFTGQETRAVADDALYGLVSFPVDGRPHHVHASMTINNGGGGTPASTADIAADAEVDGGVDSVELLPSAPGLLKTPTLRIRQWRIHGPSHGWAAAIGQGWKSVTGATADDNEYAPGSNDDPRVRYARFQTAAGDFLHAAAEFGVLLEGPVQPAQLGPLYGNLSRALLGLGALSQARSAYQSAVDAGMDAKDEMSLRLDLAEQFYQRGADAQAESVLASPPSYFAASLQPRWRDLKARVLIARGRSAEAIGLLSQTLNAGDYDSYVRYYNLGVLLIQQGAEAQGVTVLDRVGTQNIDLPEMAALRDQANLTLGVHLLRGGQSATAIPVLGRIRSRGPFANRAFLYLGWAWMGPPGTTQRRASLGDERTVGPPPESIGGLRGDIGDQNLYQRFKLQPFEQARLSADSEARRKRALAMWSELIVRDDDDDAVQEGLIAAGDALEQIGAHEASGKLYEKAATALQRSRAELSNAQQQLHSSAWQSMLQNYSFSPTRLFNASQPAALTRAAAVTLPLGDLLAGREFQGALDACRSLQQTAAALREYDSRLAGEINGADDIGYADWRSRVQVLQAEISATEITIAARLGEDAASSLSQQDRRNAWLLREAEVRVARVYDGAGTAGADQPNPRSGGLAAREIEGGT
jgi:tetratricopeptide (TPR) repeat protein